MTSRRFGRPRRSGPLRSSAGQQAVRARHRVQGTDGFTYYLHDTRGASSYCADSTFDITVGT